jgi:hypothetical protein
VFAINYPFDLIDEGGKFKDSVAIPINLRGLRLEDAEQLTDGSISGTELQIGKTGLWRCSKSSPI